ncbi:hypothetical protein [Thermoleptolyngbya sp. C42_A2020_037]|uniref:hypothetical protein n=1 Tax=Thermoleptolyngbya sp. C42_A2020_037 TaxID=2747799 RepID=UPI0019F9240C|nr:hypothetical protein [Thermoleptolyngbya sp. C42_A2020_037]MBF2086555.1 hypothetical protein [Thermoleptolyngbya sp. C42_A2020_037]
MSLYPTDTARLTIDLEQAIAQGWNPVCRITYNRDTWVNLLQPLSAYSFNEAKLLCQEASGSWVAWVPDYGEVVLDRSDFYC